jgi:hypothetical protein
MRWGAYLGLRERKWQEDEENCIMKSFIIGYEIFTAATMKSEYYLLECNAI